MTLAGDIKAKLAKDDNKPTSKVPSSSNNFWTHINRFNTSFTNFLFFIHIGFSYMGSWYLFC